MQRAIMAVIAISIFAPILGIFLILRHQSLMSDTLSHVSLAGVALGILLWDFNNLVNDSCCHDCCGYFGVLADGL